MDRATSTTIVIAVILIALTSMFLGWRKRQKRQAYLSTPDTVPTDPGPELFSAEGFYVATTMADDELNRVAVAGLGFRARATVTVTDAGVILNLAGTPEVFISRAALEAVDRATYTIDRVVETGGLVRLSWSLGETPVDSYLRLTDPADAVALIDAVTLLLPTPIPLEGDAT
ncbi:hypothetical protein [Frigoribacterium sp. CG_9.8]|uniref:PH-like domain-containing protein n=1 Tax=Frigoribacterium sp. CG_9.8 TaxID=2787733 RepID=UPI0018C91FBC|nr:hypothetical protein [Frigoribacterium sp. CG_9.8]MBG6108078.1 hypothetical protein [Frigoribacterium sp. CG_9.8]